MHKFFDFFYIKSRFLSGIFCLAFLFRSFTPKFKVAKYDGYYKMNRNSFHLRKAILGCLLTFFFVTLISTGRCTLTPIAHEDWVISPGAILKYHVEVTENNSQGSFIDILAQEYHFFDLEENFLGEPEIEVNITEIHPTTNLSSVVANILTYSNGQLDVSQKNGDDWDPKSLILPFLVPINNWDALMTEFEAQLPGEGNVSIEHSWVGEYIYNFTWYQDDPQSEGQIRFNLQCVWEEADGILQGMFLDISDAQLDYDRLSLVVSSQQLNTYSDLVEITIYISIIVIVGIMIIGMVFGMKRIAKRQLDPHNHMENLQPAMKKKFNEISDRQDIGAHQDELVQLTEKITTYRMKLIFLWPLAQVCSVGVVIVAIQILDLVSSTAQDEMPIILTIVGGISVIVALTILFNIPFFRFNKIINRGAIEPFQKYYFDPTPFITSVVFIAGIIIVGLAQSLETVSTIQGKAVIIGLIIILSLLIIYVYWLLNPWKILKQLENSIDKQHRFPSNEEKILNL